MVKLMENLIDLFGGWKLSARLLKTLVIAIFALVVTVSVLAQDYKSSDFVEVPLLPRAGSDEWRALNHSQNSVRVEIINGKLKFSKPPRKQTLETYSSLPIEGGKLLATDRGEWGGKIEFISDQTGKPLLIKEGNVISIFNHNGSIYFVEGLAHIAVNRGAMYRLERKSNDQFVFTKLFDFDDAPEMVTVSYGVIYIASHAGLYVVQDLKSKKIFSDTFWSSLYPNSMVVLDPKNIYIGIRGGYAKVNVPEERIQFFKLKVD
jgi:hypothetical protein